jgi:hypothetical protein
MSRRSDQSAPANRIVFITKDPDLLSGEVLDFAIMLFIAIVAVQHDAKDFVLRSAVKVLNHLVQERCTLTNNKNISVKKGRAGLNGDYSRVPSCHDLCVGTLLNRQLKHPPPFCNGFARGPRWQEVVYKTRVVRTTNALTSNALWKGILQAPAELWAH